jgi:hypothetical protein
MKLYWQANMTEMNLHMQNQNIPISYDQLTKNSKFPYVAALHKVALIEKKIEIFLGDARLPLHPGCSCIRHPG